MNILFFAGRIIYGGGEKVQSWLVKQLHGAGHSIFYMTPVMNEEYKQKLKTVGLDKIVTSITFDRKNKKRNPFKYINEIKYIFANNKIDLFIILGGSLIEQLVAKKLGVKVLLSERCDPHSRTLPSQILKQIQYRFSDGYVFQTPEASKCYGKRANNIGVVIPNPIIDDLPIPQIDHLRKEIVSVGRLSKEKNHKLLIEAFVEFNKVHPGYQLIIYGSGPLDETLQNIIEKNNVKDVVSIIKGKRNISELINGAELFVLPSNTEGMPNALIEAMSMGILSISTDCPIYGPRMLVKHGINAYLIPVNDKNALFMQMCYAVEHGDEATIIRRNSVNIQKTLDSNAIFNSWLKYINKIMVR